jgi:hypothetical protein
MNRTTSPLPMAALSLLMSATALQVANIQIKYLPYTISAPGTYVLTTNLTTSINYSSSQGTAITILTTVPGPVVLDFKGYTITWTGTTGGAFGVFIGVPGFGGIANTFPMTLKNGTICKVLL